MPVTKADTKKSATVVEESPAKPAPKTYEGLTREQLIEIYRLMYLSRKLDDREGPSTRLSVAASPPGPVGMT